MGFLTVTSGILKGIRLHAPHGFNTRPTTQKVRQAAFNILRHKNWHHGGIGSLLEGASVVDLFAGSGAWGIEAISHGASSVTAVESHRAAQKVLQMNFEIAASSLSRQRATLPSLTLLRTPVEVAYRKLSSCRILFADPPYGENGFLSLVKLESQHAVLEPAGLLVFEAAESDGVDAFCASSEGVQALDLAGLRLLESKKYGDSALHLFIKGT